MKKVASTFILALTFCTIGLAQANTYFTRDATLTIYSELDGEPLELMTRKLGVKLNYETAYFIVRFPVSTLESGVDSLDALLKESKTEVVFDGKLGMDYVNTENQPPQKFDMEGWLAIGDSKTLVSGEGELHHVGNSTEYACMMGLTLQLNFDDLNISLPVAGLDKNFEAIVTQGLLQQDRN